MTAVAIFVKTPGLSPIKSRLAGDIGPALASECHLRCAATVAAVVRAAAIGPVYWAVAEAEGRQHPAWRELPVLVQQGSGLGERMRSIHDRLIELHGRAVLLGADLPQLEPSALIEASERLEKSGPRGVIGPARDGGFWLLGSNRALPASVWQTPVYGGPDVLKSFRAAARKQGSWSGLMMRTDLDRISDLGAVIDELRRLPEPHPLQVDLVNWLESLRRTCT